MNVSLTPKLENLVRSKVASGLYNNASEVIREALRLLLERDGGTVAAVPDMPDAGRVRAVLAAMEKSLRARGVTSVALFGSLPRGAAGPDSDINLLVDLDPGAGVSLVDLTAIKIMIEDRLGRAVDLVTRDGLDPRLRDRVLKESERLF